MTGFEALNVLGMKGPGDVRGMAQPWCIGKNSSPTKALASHGTPYEAWYHHNPTYHTFDLSGASRITVTKTRIRKYRRKVMAFCKMPVVRI